jgi:hypothetical protein
MSAVSIVDGTCDIGPPTHERRPRAEGGILRAVATAAGEQSVDVSKVRPYAATSQSATRTSSIADDIGATA